jgi:translation elongation factor P/translation initiation factor 5A
MLKKGQEVVCIINTRAVDVLTIGKKYTLIDDESYNSYEMLGDDGYRSEYSASRFMSSAEFRVLSINQILK